MFRMDLISNTTYKNTEIDSELIRIMLRIGRKWKAFIFYIFYIAFLAMLVKFITLATDDFHVRFKKNLMLENNEELLFSFGVFTDVQYAKTENRLNYPKNKWRFYNNSLNQLRTALDFWVNRSPGISFVVNLGDLLDGINKKLGTQDTNLLKVKSLFDEYQLQYLHVLGNHEYLNFNRTFLLKSFLNSAEDKRKLHYAFSPFDGFRFVALDSMEISVLGHTNHSDPGYIRARDSLTLENPNEDWNSMDGMEGTNVRFVKGSGMLSETQLSWLNDTLNRASQDNEIVVLFSHHIIHPDAGDKRGLCWNYNKILRIIDLYDCVVLHMAGHCHDGGFTRDNRVTHVVFPAMVETPINMPGFATVDVYDDHMEIICSSPRMPERYIKFWN